MSVGTLFIFAHSKKVKRAQHCKWIWGQKLTEKYRIKCETTGKPTTKVTYLSRLSKGETYCGKLGAFPRSTLFWFIICSFKSFGSTMCSRSFWAFSSGDWTVLLFLRVPFNNSSFAFSTGVADGKPPCNLLISGGLLWTRFLLLKGASKTGLFCTSFFSGTQFVVLKGNDALTL